VKALLIGGAGPVGHPVATRLVARGDDVVVADRTDPALPVAHHRVDPADPVSVARELDTSGPVDVVVLCCPADVVGACAEHLHGARAVAVVDEPGTALDHVAVVRHGLLDETFQDCRGERHAVGRPDREDPQRVADQVLTLL
jgi:predicted dinucleotide-binding enzyme